MRSCRNLCVNNPLFDDTEIAVTKRLFALRMNVRCVATSIDDARSGLFLAGYRGVIDA